MRSIAFVILVAASMGMAGTSSVSAAPANGLSLGSVTAMLGNADQVHYYYRRGYYGRGDYSRGYYGRSYYGGGYYNRGYCGRGYYRGGSYGYRY